MARPGSLQQYSEENESLQENTNSEAFLPAASFQLRTDTIRSIGVRRERRSFPRNWDLRAGTPFPPTPDLAKPNPEQPMNTVGICWIVYGIFRLGVGVAAVLCAPTATFMFGALLSRVADPFTWMGFFHLWYVCWVGLCFVCGILGVLGGLAWLRAPNSGRRWLLVASFLSLSDLPVGIAISVYTLIVLLHGPVSTDRTLDRNPPIRQDIS